jgi:hypothetical protein
MSRPPVSVHYGISLPGPFCTRLAAEGVETISTFSVSLSCLLCRYRIHIADKKATLTISRGIVMNLTFFCHNSLASPSIKIPYSSTYRILTHRTIILRLTLDDQQVLQRASPPLNGPRIHPSLVILLINRPIIPRLPKLRINTHRIDQPPQRRPRRRGRKQEPQSSQTTMFHYPQQPKSKHASDERDAARCEDEFVGAGEKVLGEIGGVR